MDAYVESWKHGVKAIAIYRDGSKKVQPLSTSSAASNEKKAAAPVAVVSERVERRRLADTRASLTHKFKIEGHEGYITVGLFEDGTPGELFVTMAKEGSTLSGMMDAFATSTSLLLQYRVPLPHLVEKFQHMRFEPSGWAGNGENGVAKTTPQLELLERIVPAATTDGRNGANGHAAPTARRMNSTPDAPPCPRCGWLTVRNGTCHKCE